MTAQTPAAATVFNMERREIEVLIVILSNSQILRLLLSLF